MRFDYFLYNDIEKKYQYSLSILIVALVSGVCFIFSVYVSAPVVAFILFLTLSVISMFFDIYPVLLAALLSALIWDYFFVAPKFDFRLLDTESRVLFCTYFIIAFLNAMLTSKIKELKKIAHQKEEKAHTLKLYNTLLNSLSHELRTPIATIIGAADGLLSKPSKLSANDKKSLVSEILAASLRLNQQVENLLNMSRLESGFVQPKKDWCDVNELVYDTIKRLDEYLKNHRLRIDIKEGLPLFKLDYGLIEQVLYNLIYNATQYTPAGSLIEISAENIGEELIIVIEDGGNGFPEDEIEKVFEKFYRLKNTRTGGTGLGLSIVKGFIEAHKGLIELKNSAKGGAIFTIKIPADKMLIKQVEK